MLKRHFIKFSTFLTLAIAMLGVQSIAAEHTPLPGKDYAIIDPPANPVKGKSDKIEVVSIFSYTCGHCFRIDPLIDKWAEKHKDEVELVRLAVPGQGLWELYSKTFFTLEALDKVNLGHKAMFDATMNKRKRFTKKEEIAKFLAPIINVDEAQFLKTWDSFAVTTAFNRAADILNNQYGVNYTPAFVINGKYFIDVGLASENRTENADPYQKTVNAIDDLVAELLSEKDSQKKDD